MYVRWDAAAPTDLLRLRRPNEPHEPHRPPHETAVHAPATAPRAATEVSVWLFGALGDPRQPRPLRLRCPSPCRLRDVLDELGRRMERGSRAQWADRQLGAAVQHQA